MSADVAITVGSFDGVHLGHLALVAAARSAVGAQGKVIVLSFEPHPLSVLRPAAAPMRLSTLQQRIGWLTNAAKRGPVDGRAAADEVIPITPTRELLRQSPPEFVAEMARRYAPSAIVEGPDFRFGRDRAGSPETLRALEAEHGYRTLIIDPVEAALTDQSLVRVSSSLIRWLISHGRVRDAARLLGRPYELAGTVVPGDGRGREMGVPTVNLDPGDLLLPADGVYAGWAIRPDGRRFAAAISVGCKPTFGDHPRTCEAHLIGYAGASDDYGWPLRLSFDDWLRDQIAYGRVEPLVEQIQRDVAQAAALGSGHR